MHSAQNESFFTSTQQKTVFYQTLLSCGLIVSSVITVVGSAVKVVALENTDNSTPDWEVLDNDVRSRGEQDTIPNSSVPTTKNYVSQLQLPQDRPRQDIPPSPRIITPRPPEQPTPTPAPVQEEPLEPTEPTPPQSETRPDLPGTITVDRFEFIGNTAFSNDELTDVTQPFTGKPITFSELLQVEAAVTKKYTEAGYINSGAVIPADQTLTPQGAVVKIQIIEGGVEAIQVRGTQRLNPNYVRSRLRRAASTPLNREKLLEALQLLQLNPLFKNISAELSAGSRPEQSVLEVQVEEANTFQTEVFVDNARTPSVGSIRRGVRISQGNVLGFGDGLEATYTNTDGSNAYDFSYTVPINPRNGTIKVAAGLNRTEVVEPPFDRIDITGNSRYYELTFRQPIIQAPSQEFAIGITGSRQESETKLLDIEFPLSAGADENGKTRISALRFFQEWTRRSPQQIFALRSQFSLGLGVFDATINEKAPDSRFFSWRGQAQYVRLLAPETLLVVRTDAQLSTRTLVPLEQYSLGGLRSVRGYRQDLLLTDNAVFASAEVRLPILRARRVGGVLQVAPFVDFGVGWNSSGGTVAGSNTLLGVGLGLQWQMGDKFTARFDWGVPLIDTDSGDRTLQEQGLYFSVNYSLF
jgi:hemolysin activation/secretion protein